jgi:hypothetical protein
MNLASVALLPAQPRTGRWFRTVDPRFFPTAIATSHTLVVPSRFYDPYSASPPFRVLYLSDHPLVAQFEAQVLFGSPTAPGGTVPGPRAAWVVLGVQVSLAAIVDLSDISAQALLDCSAQELTGDWNGYRQRSRATPVGAPVGAAPTQMLGEAIRRDQRGLEGFAFLSARLPYHRNLAVFPEALGGGSYVEYEMQDPGSGQSRRFRVDATDPEGRLV